MSGAGSSGANAGDALPWVDREGAPVSCAEKLKVLRENDAELRQALQDAFEDGVLMGVTPDAMRASFEAMLVGLEDPTGGSAVPSGGGVR